MAYRLSERGAAARPLTRPETWVVAVVATLVMSVSYVDRQTLAALAPTVRVELGISATQYGWLTGAFSIAYLVGAPLAGILVDRAGARIGLIVAVLAWSCVSALHAVAPSFVVLFALRIALGAAEAPSFPAAAQAVRRSLARVDRSTGFGLLFTGSSIGAAIAAPLAIAFKVRFGWRAAFLGTAAVGLAWVPLWLLVSSSGPARTALAQPNTSEASRGRASLALVLDPAVVRALLLVIASAPAIGFCFNWLPQYLVSARGLTQDGLGRYLVLPSLFFDVGAVGFGFVASRREAASLIHGSHKDLVALAATASALIALVPLAAGPWMAVTIASISMAGGGGLFALLTADMLSRVEPSRISSAGGMTAAAQSLAYIVANPLIGAAVDRLRSYTGVLVALGALVIPGAAAWMAWPVERPRVA